MIYRDLDGAKVSMLGFGCMRFKLDENKNIIEESAAELFDNAFKAGVNYFDTAYNYCNGESEIITGKLLDKYPRDSYYLATKLPVWKCQSVEDAKNIFEEQLKKLNKDYIDFYLLHAIGKKDYDRVKELGIVEFVQSLKNEGKIKHYGFSFHDDYNAFEHILTDRKWDFCQIQYNYMDCDSQATDKGYALAEKLGVPLIIMEPLKGGTLANLPDSVKEPFKQVNASRSEAAWSMKWLASHKNVKLILSGMNEDSQLYDNVEALDSESDFTDEEFMAVADVKDAIHKRVRNGCTGCAYCMPCPSGVDIPGNFRRWNDYAMYHEADVDGNWRFAPSPNRDGGAEKCIGCGQCESICPQKINIIEDLKKIVKESTK